MQISFSALLGLTGWDGQKTDVQKNTHICSKTQQGVMGEMEAGRKRKKKSRVCVSVSSWGQYFGTSKTAAWCWILTTLSFFTASSHTCMPLDSSTSTRPRYYKDRKEKTELKQMGWNKFFPNFCCYRWWLSLFIRLDINIFRFWHSLGQGSYICPFVRLPRQPATDVVCWPLARRWASSSSDSDEVCSSPGSRAPWYCGHGKQLWLIRVSDTNIDINVKSCHWSYPTSVELLMSK